MARAHLWSTERPTLYEVAVSLGSKGDGEIVAVGFRKMAWNATTGFALNDEALKIMGSANHQVS